MTKVSLAADVMQPIPRIGDGHAFLINWAGGLQSAEKDKDQWHILPLQHGNKPHASGYYSKAAMQAFMTQRGVRFIAYQQINWMKGEYTSHWAPLIPGENNFSESPANLWSHVAGNLSRARAQPLIGTIENPTIAQIEAIRDAHSEPERLARSISLSLRNLDTSVAEIAAFYHDELTNFLAAGKVDGLRSSSMRDQTLYALVHSFFLHLGGARDYLAAFVALKLGMDITKTDSMARLIEALRGPDNSGSPILQLLASKGYVRPKATPSTKWEAAGWLDEVTDLRNELTHRRTYGHTMAERMGHVCPIDADVGLYRYFRPISWKTSDQDVFDVMIGHYERVNELFFAAAKLSGHDISILQITDKDVISLEMTTRK
ncbi:hypothetical protein [Mesorhizobium sophorae]|uniref:hypothetical protein n=1 Tax=Mesorhizobium sophorae TaxID=1300294 RepID=UPI00118047FC|nr:hypothetical protein [Mesorhizobium sophorae]